MKSLCFKLPCPGLYADADTQINLDADTQSLSLDAASVCCVGPAPRLLTNLPSTHVGPSWGYRLRGPLGAGTYPGRQPPPCTPALEVNVCVLMFNHCSSPLPLVPSCLTAVTPTLSVSTTVTASTAAAHPDPFTGRPATATPTWEPGGRGAEGLARLWA